LDAVLNANCRRDKRGRNVLVLKDTDEDRIPNVKASIPPMDRRRGSNSFGDNCRGINLLKTRGEIN